MYQVKLNNRAKKDLRKLDRRFQEKIGEMIDRLSQDPLIGIKLSGDLNDSYKIKIPPLRIVYSPNFKSKIILVKSLGFRGGGVYKKL